MLVVDRALEDGFRLAGSVVYTVDDDRDAGEVEAIVREIRKQPDVGIVLVDERFVTAFEEALSEAGDDYLVASLPSAAVRREGTYLDELTRRYLGQKIYAPSETETETKEPEEGEGRV